MIIPLQRPFSVRQLPLLALLIVALSGTLFFLLQGSDSKKLDEAVAMHLEYAYPKVDRKQFPIYAQREYKPDQLEAFKAFLKDATPDSFSRYILQRKHYYSFMDEDADALLGPDVAERWREEHARIRPLIDGLTYNQLGLVPGQLKPFTIVTYPIIQKHWLPWLIGALFLILLSTLIEPFVSRSQYGLYLALGGIVGASSFAIMDDSDYALLVGISPWVWTAAAIAIGHHLQHKVTYYYWLGKKKGYVEAHSFYLPLIWIITASALDYLGVFTRQETIAGVSALGFTLVMQVAMTLGSNPTEEEPEEEITPDEDTLNERQQLDRFFELLVTHQFDQARELAAKLFPQMQDNFEFMFVNLEMAKFGQPGEFEKTARRVLSMNSDQQSIIQSQENLWNQLKGKNIFTVDDPEFIALGIRFTRLPRIKNAEDILDTLIQNNINSQMSAKLAARIADFYRNQGKTAQANNFSRIAEEIISRLR